MRFDPNYTAQLSQAINASAASEQTLTSELSSGLRVSSLSVDPVAAATNVQLTGSISRIDSFVQSATTQQGRLQVTDTTLGDVVSQVTSAITLAVNAGNGTLSGADLSAIAQQVTDIRNNVVASANTSYEGQYLFSGSQGSTQPFTLNTTTNPATTTYNGDTVTQSIETPSGQKLPVNLAGSNVFTASGSDLLGTLNQLVSDLNAGNTTNIQADSSALTKALGNVTTQRAGLDSSLSRLNATTSYAGTQEATLKAQQSTLLSADPASVATDLKSAEVQYQALLGSEAVLNKEDLFDFLK